jgi:hypothetical protein
MAKPVAYDIIINNKGGATLKQISSESKNAKAGVLSLGEGFSELKRTVLEFAGAYAGIEIIKESLHAYTDERNELIKLGQVYKDNHGNTTLTLQQLDEMADKQENLTGIHKEETAGVEGVLLSHKNLKISYEQMIPVIEDFSKFTGGNAVEAANLFTRALANPSQAMRILRTANIDLTYAERQHLEQIAKTGDGSKAQAAIFDMLKDKYKGVAEAMYAANPEEQMALTFHQAQVALGHFEEELLVDLMPAIKAIVGEMRELISWSEKHKDTIETTGKVVGVVVAGFVAYQVVVKAAAIATGLFTASQAIAAGYTVGETLELVGLTAATEGATAATAALDVAMDANPIGLMIVAVSGLAAAFNILSDDANTAEKNMAGFLQKSTDAYTSANAAKRKEMMDYSTNDEADLENKIKTTPGMTPEWIAFIQKKIDLDKQHISSYQDIDKQKPATIGTSRNSGDLKTSSPDDLKGDKHTIITFNIKQFGAETITVHGSEEVGKASGNNMLKSLLEAIDDAQTTADIH